MIDFSVFRFFLRLIALLFYCYCISNFTVDRCEFSLDDLLPPIVEQETANCDADQSTEVPRPDTPDNDVIPQSFATRIDELNLLGEIDEEKSFVINSTRNDCKFRIDKLNL